MTDRSKVIGGIAVCLSPLGCGKDCPYYNDRKNGCQKQLRNDALELLKEQEPLVIHKLGFTAQCPECQMTWMMWQPDNMRYCPGCGRTVKWDD